MSGANFHMRGRSSRTRAYAVLAATFIASALAFARSATPPPVTVKVVAREWTGLVAYDSSRPPVKKDPALNPVFWIALPDGRDSFPDGGLGYFRNRYSYDGVVIDKGLMKYSYYKPDTFPIGGDAIGINSSLYPGSVVYEAQAPRKAGEPRPLRYADYCGKPALDKLLDDVLEHEGARASSRWKSHFWEYVRYFRTHDIGLMEEQIAFRVDPNAPAGHLERQFDLTFNQAGLAEAEAENLRIVHAPSNLIPALPCKLRLPSP